MEQRFEAVPEIKPDKFGLPTWHSFHVITQDVVSYCHAGQHGEILQIKERVNLDKNTFILIFRGSFWEIIRPDIDVRKRAIVGRNMFTRKS